MNSSNLDPKANRLERRGSGIQSFIESIGKDEEFFVELDLGSDI